MEYIELQARDGSRVYRLRYEMEALEWFEEKTGISIFRIEEDKLATRDFSWLAAAGLFFDNPDVGIDEGREVLNKVGFAIAIPKIMQRLGEDLGVDLEVASESTNGTDPKNVKSGTGRKRKQTQPESV